ncbi:MAG: sigma-E processing peptidase SpoIIGA [Coprococcus sp.]|nr:sigma-E processing peptidase SpoIIGA [Coprococcus sp.]
MSNYKTVLLGKNSRLVSALGYVDTGNFLTDQKTKRPVAIASPEVMLKLLPDSYHHIIRSYQEGNCSLLNCEVGYAHIGIHLIPYNTICNKNELMLAFDCDFFFIDNKIIQKKPLIGISKESFTLLHTNMCILLSQKFMKKGIKL